MPLGLTGPGDAILVKHEASQRARARALGLDELPRGEEREPGHHYARVAIREAFEVALQQHEMDGRGGPR